MSSNYSRVLPRAKPVKLYGFDKVSAQDLNHIVMRLQKRTYTTAPDHDPRLRRLGPQGRPLSSICRKADLDNEAYRRRPKTCVPPQMLHRINRRMQRPTISRRAALGLLTPSWELEMEERCHSSASSAEPGRSAQEREKALNRLQRPTTATRRRQPCALLEENIQSGQAEYDYSDEYFAPEDEIDEIVDRLTVATVASRGRGGDEAHCEKADFRSRPRSTQGKNLPLISGLARSRNVDEITRRLYKPFRRAPAATQTTC